MQKNSSHKSLIEKIGVKEGLTKVQMKYLKEYGPKKMKINRESLVSIDEVMMEIAIKNRDGWKLERKGKKYGMIRLIFYKWVEC